MLLVEFTALARADIRMIVQESASRFGARQAARYNDALDAACQRTGLFPEIGVPQPSLPGIRAYPSGSHRIYDAIEPDRILILRILHQHVHLTDAD